MATQAIAIPMEEYLRTSYEYDAEWVDGEVVERPLPNSDHSEAQANIDHGFVRSQKASRLFARPGLRVRVAPDRWRIPDISVFADEKPKGDYPSNVFAAIEILSPDDSMSILYDKLSEYAAMGIRHIWVADPGHRRLLKYDNESLLRVEAIEFPDRAFRLTVDEIFA
jgi:Uma2 family endonuclease